MVENVVKVDDEDGGERSKETREISQLSRRDGRLAMCLI